MLNERPPLDQVTADQLFLAQSSSDELLKQCLINILDRLSKCPENTFHYEVRWRLRQTLQLVADGADPTSNEILDERTILSTVRQSLLCLHIDYCVEYKEEAYLATLLGLLGRQNLFTNLSFFANVVSQINEKVSNQDLAANFIRRLFKNRNGEVNTVDWIKLFVTAAFNGHVKIVKALLDIGMDVDAKNSERMTALLAASYGQNTNSSLEIMELLLKKGAKASASSAGQISSIGELAKGCKLVHLLATRSDMFAGVLRTVLAQDGVSVNDRDGNQNTPLHHALTFQAENSWFIVQTLLDANADVNVRNNTGETPLFRAVRRGIVGSVSKLIDQGADINVQDTDGRTPLFDIVDNFFNKLTFLLLDSGADPELRTKQGKSFLHHLGLCYETATDDEEAKETILEVFQRYPFLLVGEVFELKGGEYNTVDGSPLLRIERLLRIGAANRPTISGEVNVPLVTIGSNISFVTEGMPNGIELIATTADFKRNAEKYRDQDLMSFIKKALSRLAADEKLNETDKPARGLNQELRQELTKFILYLRELLLTRLKNNAPQRGAAEGQQRWKFSMFPATAPDPLKDRLPAPLYQLLDGLIPESDRPQSFYFHSTH